MKSQRNAPGVASEGPRKSEPGQPQASGYNDGIALLSYIIGGILVWSLIGWGLDNALDTRWLALVGALVGAAGGLYLGHVHHLTRNAPESSTLPSQGVEDDRDKRS